MIGDTVRITFDGTTKNQRNQKVNLYKVEIAEKEDKIVDDETIPFERIEEVNVLTNKG